MLRNKTKVNQCIEYCQKMRIFTGGVLRMNSGLQPEGRNLSLDWCNGSEYFSIVFKMAAG